MAQPVAPSSEAACAIGAWRWASPTDSHARRGPHAPTFEAARLGYDVVANECDPTHLALSDLILNDGRVLCALEQRAASRTDHRAHRHLGSTTCTCAGSLQAVAGRVEQLFAEPTSAARFDAIVTSFVMDRGPTVSEWLRHIDRALRPSGVWIGAEAFQVKGHDASFGLLAGEQMADAALDRLRQWRYNLLHVDGMRGQPYADGAKRYNLTLIAARKAHLTAIEQSVYPSVLVALLPLSACLPPCCSSSPATT